MRDIEIKPAASERWPWYAAMAVVGAGIVYFTAFNFLPLFGAGSLPSPDDKKVEVPGYDYVAWHGLPTQHGGRYKPFETAATETMRYITGSARLQKRDAVAVILMWMLENDPRDAQPVGAWDEVPFILCQHQEIRRLVYLVQDDGTLKDETLSRQQIHGMYMSPAELRPFRDRFKKLEDQEKIRFKELFSDHLNQIGEILHRLALYDAIRRVQAPDDKKSEDPFAFVALDRVPGSPWFSFTEIRQIVNDPKEWREMMKERVKNAPQLYISPENQHALEAFQNKVKAGQAAAQVDALETLLKERRAKTVEEYLALREKGKQEDAGALVYSLLQTVPRSEIPGENAPDAMQESVHKVVLLLKEEREKKAPDRSKEIAAELGNLLNQRDARVLDDFKERLPKLNARYDPADPKYRMLHLSYLEIRYPDLYQIAMRWQEAPLEKCKTLLGSLDALGTAYRSGDAGKFAGASESLFAAIGEVSAQVGSYPGEDTILERVGAVLSGGPLNPPSAELLDLEQSFNRVKPFMWAWIVMLAALLMFCLSLGLDSRRFYIAGCSLYAVSLAFQVFGFFTRVIMSGRPPVSNMYETVIWVSFMSAIFALVLEAIYRRKVIALAGAMVATLGLVLADQLPLALDPKISPLVPVLRSNFWLTIHVLTIVSSYAGGTLAWGLGNISLVLIVFGAAGRKETIKTLAQFTYRALQIAVLLLAAGTFLGGWWAAYSWGRFWGWDPKETGALIALLCYVIPLHMRYAGWIKDLGLAIAAILCYAAILISWYGVNFIFPAGLHAYGFGAGGASWVYWACLVNIEWVLVASYLYKNKTKASALPAPAEVAPSEAKSEYVKA